MGSKKESQRGIKVVGVKEGREKTAYFSALSYKSYNGLKDGTAHPEAA